MLIIKNFRDFAMSYHDKRVMEPGRVAIHGSLDDIKISNAEKHDWSQIRGTRFYTDTFLGTGNIVLSDRRKPDDYLIPCKFNFDVDTDCPNLVGLHKQITRTLSKQLNMWNSEWYQLILYLLETHQKDWPKFDMRFIAK